MKKIINLLLKLMGLVIGLFLLYNLWCFLWVVWYNYVPPQSTAIMREELERIRQTEPQATLRYEWVDYERISPHLKRAAIASEDANFLTHGGVDWNAIEKAYEHNLKIKEKLQKNPNRKVKPVRGGSTISQQLAKNLFLSNSRNYLRKGQELIITYMIELVMSKQRILELYLNIAEWGEGVFGAQAAAQHYFNIDAKKLTAAQSARLVSMLPRPKYYEQNPGSNYLKQRSSRLLRYMGGTDTP